MQKDPDTDKKMISLEDVSSTNTFDLIAALTKASASLTNPILGPYLAELVGMIIPHQKIDRLVKYVGELDKRLTRLEREPTTEQIKDETFTDLIEEGLRQAALSLSDERREYIASLVANGIASTDIEYQESKHLLKILGELNDIEIIWLRNYFNTEFGRDEEFREKQKNVIVSISRAMGQEQIVYDKAAIQDSYKEHLARIGLLSKKLKIDQKTGLPIIDKWSGEIEVSTYQITPLGRLILRCIGLVAEDDH
jgi:hypothetical protein